MTQPSPLQGKHLALGTVGASLVFAVVYGFLAVRKLAMHAVHAFDFAIFDQGLWLLSRFQEPFVTVRGLNLFADHSSYILVLLAPLYWLWADPRLLVVVTVVAVAATAPLTYLLTRALGAGAGLALVTGVGTLLHPAASWNLWDGFHPEILVVPLIIAAFLLIARDRSWWAMALVAVALLAKEDVGLVVAPLGVYVAWVMGKRGVGLAMVAAGTAAFLVNMFVLLPALSPSGSLIYAERFSRFGSGLFGILGGVLTQPAAVAADLFADRALVYIAVLVLPLPLALLAPRLLVTGVPFLVVNLLSENSFQQDVRFHYTAYLLLVVVLAAAVGAGRLQGRPRRDRRIGTIAAVVMAVVWHVGGAPNPITNAEAWRVDRTTADLLSAAVEIVPPDAAVSGWDTSVPLLAHRTHVYSFPNPFRDLVYGTSDVAPPDPSIVEWVLVRLDQYPELQPDAAALLTSSTYEIVYESGPVILLRRVS